jgi:AraC-like DNA-binding protein
MLSKDFTPPDSIALFVKNISVFESNEATDQTTLPFFADGYPGLMFQQTQNGLRVNPHDKQMPVLFLYGQTLKPIELVMHGPYKLIGFQLYPFVLRQFFGVNPKDINDHCYDLSEVPEIKETIAQLQLHSNFEDRVAIISDFLSKQFISKKEQLDFTIREAIQLILDRQGQLSVGDLCDTIGLNERTLERKFQNEVGVSPKQFCKIIQFQQSYGQLTGKDFEKLTDIVYGNGFSDQSHFIKVFKAFTGKTPKHFSKK